MAVTVLSIDAMVSDSVTVGVARASRVRPEFFPLDACYNSRTDRVSCITKAAK
jgi:hypothetical protein